MNQELLDRIAKLIFPYLKTKHKDKESYEIARRILEEVDKEPPTWYTHSMIHECSFELDLDGQVTCSICGAMDDDKQPIDIFETQMDFE